MRSTMVNSDKEIVKSRVAWGFAYFLAFIWLLIALVLFIIFQDKLVKGMMAGAVKG